jgi:hypothetical protein
MIECKGGCDQIHHEPTLGFHNGQKYCSPCRYYITTIERYCTCCHSMFRSKRRHNKRRQSGVLDDKINFDFGGIEN